MIELRRSEERGHFDHGWLKSWHSFSFGDYFDPANMGFRALRVLNEDVVQPGKGFPAHGHRDMEIVTYVLAGELEHRDSLGNGSVIRPGEIQRMTAGTGVRHSELNPSASEPTHLLQIWILPEREGLEPGYEQRAIPAEELRDRLRLIASRTGRDGSVTVHQDVEVYAARLAADAGVEHALAPGRHAWVQVARGTVAIGSELLGVGEWLAAGDGAAVSDEPRLAIRAGEPAEVLLFDLG